MHNHNKTAVVITKNELIEDWLEDVISLVGQDCFFIVIPEANSLNIFDRLFLKLNFKILGSLETDITSDQFNIIDVKRNVEIDFDPYQTILNFTCLKLSIPKEKKFFQFLISRRTYNQREVVFNMLRSYKKIELTIQSNDKDIETSTIRLDGFSVTKATTLILASFLVLFEAQITCGSNTYKLLTAHKAPEAITFINYIDYGYRFLVKLKHYFFYNEQWILGYSFNVKSIGVDLKNDVKIIPPKDRFWADPVIIEGNGKYFVFIEELIFKNKIAHLSVFELKEDGSYTTPTIILKTPYHLSYPFAFNYNDKYYMVPETAENNDIQLYEAVEFPYKWKYKQTLMENIKASDTTLLYKNNKWWLFTSIKRFNNGAYDNDLSVFYSDNLFSATWKPHKEMPLMQITQKL